MDISGTELRSLGYKPSLVLRFFRAIDEFNRLGFINKEINREVCEEMLRDKNETAYHEAGHVIAAVHTNRLRFVISATIEPLDTLAAINPFKFRNLSSMGGYMKVPYIPLSSISNDEIFDEMVELCAGQPALAIKFPDSNKIETGFVNDFALARALAGMIVSPEKPRPGRSVFSKLSYVFRSAIFLKSSDMNNVAQHEKIERLFLSAQKKARTIIYNNQDQLEAVACALLDRGTLQREDIYSVLGKKVHNILQLD